MWEPTVKKLNSNQTLSPWVSKKGGSSIKEGSQSFTSNPNKSQLAQSQNAQFVLAVH